MGPTHGPGPMSNEPACTCHGLTDPRIAAAVPVDRHHPQCRLYTAPGTVLHPLDERAGLGVSKGFADDQRRVHLIGINRRTL